MNPKTRLTTRTVRDKIIATAETLNAYLQEAARRGIEVDLLAGLSPPVQTETNFYVAKVIHVRLPQ